jgi:hypothetical protein
VRIVSILKGCAGLRARALPVVAMLVAVVTFATSLHAQMDDDSSMLAAEAAVAKPKQEIKVSKKELNFGTLKRGKTKQMSFTIKNNSKTTTLTGAVLLPSVIPYAIIAGGGSFVLPPKSKPVTVTVQFDSGFPGIWNGTIPINSNDLVAPSLIVKLHGVVPGPKSL